MKNLGDFASSSSVDRKVFSQDEKIDLLEKYSVLVKVMAYRMIGRLPSNHFVEDLISCGTIGLLEAVENFDSRLNVKFETFAKFRIRGAMIDEMRQRDWIPRSVRSKIREIESLQRKLSTEMQRMPQDQDMAAALSMTLEEYYTYLIDLQPAGMLSYEDLGGNESERNTIDFLEDKSSPHPDIEIQMKELKHRIIAALEHLEKDEQLALALYYYEGLTLKEISDVIQVTESRVSQIHSKALTKLHWRLDDYKKDLKEELNEETGKTFH